MTLTVTQEIVTLGNTEVYGNTVSMSDRRAIPVTFSEDGEIQSISIYHNGGTGNLLLGVYSDQPGLPTTRLGVTAVTVLNTVEGWQTVSLTSPVIVTSGQTVWLAWIAQNAISVRYSVGTPGRALSIANWATGMPATFGASSILDYKYSVYCTYITGTLPPTLTVSPTNLSLDHVSGSNGIFNINSNTIWSITYVADWLDVTPVSGSNNGTITVTANSANTGTSPRIATLTIAGTGVTDKTVTVTQEIVTLGNTEVYGNTVTMSDRRAIPVTFSEDGAIQSISIYHNGGTGNLLLGVYSDQPGLPTTRLGVTAVTVLNTVEGWQTVSLTSPVIVTSGQTVWLAWVAQNAISVRYAVGTPGRALSTAKWAAGMPATFGASSILDYKYSVYCNYTTVTLPPTLTVSPTSVSLDHVSGSNGIFNINSNTIWSITYVADWLDVTPVSGSNNGIITVTANSANTGTSPRIATLTIAGTGVTDKTVTVTQENATLGNTEVYGNTVAIPYRRAIPVTFSEDGEIQSISIYHNGGTGNLLLGVYSDQPGLPTTRLGVTAATVLNSGEGWQTVSLTSPVAVTSGQTVWLGWVFQNSIGVRYTSGTPGRALSTETWTAGMPAAFGSSSIENFKYSIYCNYTTNAVPPTLAVLQDDPKSAQVVSTEIVSQKFEAGDLKVYPNPFSDKLRFEFVSPESVNARIDLYDMTGRMVKTIFEQPIEGNISYEAEFRPEAIISGMYIYRVILGETVYNGKVVFKGE